MLEIRQVVLRALPTAKESLEEQIALVAADIERCKREIRIGEEAWAQYRKLQAQLGRLATEYARAG